MQGSLLSNIQKGLPTIDVFNTMGYDVATFGNHEFDWGKTVLLDRTTQATYPYVTANIVVKDTADCASTGWTLPSFADAPYQVQTVGTAPQPGQSRIHRRHDPGDADHHDRVGYRGSVLQGPD